MIRNWYNQIPHPALKTKREITKYINWPQFTKGTRGKQLLNTKNLHELRNLCMITEILMKNASFAADQLSWVGAWNAISKKRLKVAKF